MKKKNSPPEKKSASAKSSPTTSPLQKRNGLHAVEGSADKHSPRSVLPLTPKEKLVCEFICGFFSSNGYSPSYQEIKDHFGFASYNSIQNYLKQLSRKGYISLEANQKRALQVLHSPNEFYQDRFSTTESPAAGLLQKSVEALSVPLLGMTAAGLPLERIYHEESVTVPINLVKHADKTFALLVEGQSMVDEGIHDGDTIIVEKVSAARDGDLVVATIDSEATVKRIFYHPKNDVDRRVELRPSNRELDSMWYSPFQVSLQGRVVGLLRKYS
ncbi:MAG: transcriptional repressor LexA [Bdellovibrionota bacterium]